jgi:hypothetical protein
MRKTKNTKILKTFNYLLNFYQHKKDLSHQQKGEYQEH